MKTKAPPRPQFSWEMCKHSFTCSVKSTVYTNPSRKRSFGIEMLVQTGGGTDLKMSSFRVFQSGLSEVFSNTNPKWLVIIAFLNFSGVVWTENVRCVFRVKTPFSSFSSGAFRRGPEAGINKWSIRSHKLAYSKRKEITSMKGVDFLQLLYKRCGLKKKTHRIWNSITW